MRRSCDNEGAERGGAEETYECIDQP